MLKLVGKQLIQTSPESIGKQLKIFCADNTKDFVLILNDVEYPLTSKDGYLLWDIPNNINKNELKIKIKAVEPTKKKTVYTTIEKQIKTIHNSQSTDISLSMVSPIVTNLANIIPIVPASFSYDSDTNPYDPDYPFYSMTDQHPPIIINNRKIEMQTNYQIVVARDSSSQLLAFQSDRYFDGIDRATKNIWIRYVNSKNINGETTAVNVYIIEDKLIFGWLLDNNVAIAPGKVEFLIEFSGDDEKGNPYLWQTVPSSLTVEKGLWTDDENAVIEKYPSTIEGLQTKIKLLEETMNNINIGFKSFD